MLAVSLFAELSILQQFNTYIDYRYPAPSALRAAPPMGSQEDSALSVISQAFFINSHYTKQRGALSQLYLSSYTRLETFRECLHLKTEVPVCHSAQCIGFSIGHELYQNQNNVVIRLTQ